MFRRMAERQHNLNNSDEYNRTITYCFLISSIFPGGLKPELVIENEIKKYTIDITVAFDSIEGTGVLLSECLGNL